VRQVVRLRFEAREELAKLSRGAIYECFQCGTCTATCPLTPSTGIRRAIRSLQLGLVEPAYETAWSCVSCGLCEARCPHQVPIAEALRSARVKLYEARRAPERVDEVLWSVYEEGNPLSMPRRERNAWARGLPLSGKADVLIYPCCLQAYDPRQQKILRALVALLARAGYRVGLASDAVCCGDAVYWAGEEGLLEELAKANADALESSQASIIVVPSPHALYMLTKVYPRYGAKVSAKLVHPVQLLAEAVNEGRLGEARLGAELVVTYHDPCYLGRRLGVYDEPRRLVGIVEGVKLVEMPRSREDSLCCGGGGGAMWLENRSARRLAAERLREAKATGARVLVTACPYCTRMFEDEERLMRTGLRVLDVVELLASALGVRA
jgi:Fe-S oxidoreductase